MVISDWVRKPKEKKKEEGFLEEMHSPTKAAMRALAELAKHSPVLNPRNNIPN